MAQTAWQEIKRMQDNLNDENDGVALYHLLAEAEPAPERRRIFERLSGVEARHAEIWRRKLREAGVEPQEHGPGTKVRIAGWVAHRFGVQAALPIIRGLEASAYATYMAQGKTAMSMAPEELQHGVTLTRLEQNAVGQSGAKVQERWHRTGGGGVLRAGVFGINDGLVSNTSLVMGFAGAQVPASVVLFAGIAGLLAGAFSMAVGEYISMRAQRELYEHQIEIERRELAAAPEEEEEELAAIYTAKGLPEDQARQLAGRLTRDPAVALDVLIREELGLDPAQLGSAWGAAVSSFIAFGIGALIPVLPFMFVWTSGVGTILVSAAASAAALFAVGVVLSLFTGRNFVLNGARQLGLGAAAAIITYILGAVVGVQIAA